MLIIGDIHGDYQKLQRIVEYADTEHMLFVGDFLDSFVFHYIEQIKCVDLILSLIESGKADAILGNHELSYIYPIMTCSGFRSQTKSLLEQEHRLERIKYLFKKHVYLKEQKILITHAGMTAQFATNYKIDSSNIDIRLDELSKLPLRDNPIYNIGTARFGSSNYPGIFWCDWNHEFRPIDGIRQVMGHTHVYDIRLNDGNYNIDCLQHKNKILRYDMISDKFFEIEF